MVGQGHKAPGRRFDGRRRRRHECLCDVIRPHHRRRVVRRGIHRPLANAPFPTCNSIGYSNGVWVASNNTGATNILARSTNGGSTWAPVAASSVSGILTGAAAIGANAFCNYSLAVADYSNDTNLRSWVAVKAPRTSSLKGGLGRGDGDAGCERGGV